MTGFSYGEFCRNVFQPGTKMSNAICSEFCAIYLYKYSVSFSGYKQLQCIYILKNDRFSDNIMHILANRAAATIKSTRSIVEKTKTFL